MFSHSDEVSRLFWVISIAAIGLVLNPNSFLLFTPWPLIVILSDYRLFGRALLYHWRVVCLLPACLLLFHYVVLGAELHVQNSDSMTDDISGATIAIRLFFVVLFSLTFFDNTDPRRLAHGITRLGFSYKWAFVAYLSLSQVDALRSTAQDINDSIKLRMGGHRRGLPMTIRLFVYFVFLLIVDSIIRAEKTATALRSRGLGLKSTRTFMRTHHWTATGLLLLAVTYLWTFTIVLH
jgi:energy-coupling factor transporter transmembrane protein EcfT